MLDVGEEMVCAKKGLAFECWDFGRLTSLLGTLR